MKSIERVVKTYTGTGVVGEEAPRLDEFARIGRTLGIDQRSATLPEDTRLNELRVLAELKQHQPARDRRAPRRCHRTAGVLIR